LVSSDFTYIGIDGQPLSARPRFQFSDAILRFLLFFVNPICHSTLIGRRELFLKHPYSTQAKHAEDFELWHRMAAEGVTIRNIRKRLLQFRCSAESISSRYEEEQNATSLRISADAIERYFGVRPEADVHRILMNRMRHGSVSRAALKAALILFRHMKGEY